MAIMLGRKRGELNVTPMIDILLVLLIIFMVIAPELSTGLDTLVPQPSTGSPQANPQDVVITVLRGGKLLFNQSEIDVDQLAFNLRELLKKGIAGAAFVKGSDDVDFGEVAGVIDVTRGTGWAKVALLPN